MKIKEWWKRLLSKFGDKNDEPDVGSTMELVAGPAPEPVPERKTSDEIIIEMADSTLESEERMAGPVPETEDDLPREPVPETAECEPAEPAPEIAEDEPAEPVPETAECEPAEPAPEIGEERTEEYIPETDDDYYKDYLPEKEDGTDGV